MNDPTLQLRAGIVTAINAAMTANGKTCPVFSNPPHNQSLPYVHLSNVFINPRHNKTHEGTTSYHVIVTYADDPDEVLTLSNIVLEAISDRSSEMTVAASVKLITYELDFITGPTEIDTPQGVQYGVSIRLQYRTHE